MSINETTRSAPRPVAGGRQQLIKCVVWDLDNTVWDGILLEDETVRLRSEVRDVITTLDARGILHSIASRNDEAKALQQLAEFGLQEYFIYPQINWDSKVSSLEVIARKINIGLDAIAFIDDDPFERGAISFSYPEVLCLDASVAGAVPGLPQMMPEFVTADAKMRRLLYRSDSVRAAAESEFAGPREEFLATLNMSLSIAPAEAEDLLRAQELTVRTHQLNATGYTYSHEQLEHFRTSDRHQLLIAGLTDKYGTYGKIGLALVECDASVWTLKLLLMSCRVVSRGVGAILLNHLMRQAKEQGVALRAEFVPTDLNRMMYVAYKFAGFREVGRHGAVITLECDLTRIQPLPDYVEVIAP
jgi:FkbH-like protein